MQRQFLRGDDFAKPMPEDRRPGNHRLIAELVGEQRDEVPHAFGRKNDIARKFFR